MFEGEHLTMSTIQKMSILALRQVVRGAGKLVGAEMLAEGTAAVAVVLANRFVDHSRRLERALREASDRAWRALELALAGPSWWQSCQLALSSAEPRGFRQQVQAFLDAAPLGDLPGHGADFRAEALRQLRAARKAGLLTGGNLDPRQLAEQTAPFARFDNPTAVLDAEWRTLDGVAADLRQAGYRALADLVALRAGDGPSLLAVAAGYFFRRQVESDEQLFKGLAFARLERLAEGQEQGFAALADALANHGQRLDQLLGEVRDVVVETHGDVLDIKAEVQRQGRQVQELGQAVLAVLQQRRLDRRALNAGDSLSLSNESERQLVKALLARYRGLPEEKRRQWPALLQGVAKLEVIAGDFDAAQRDFQQVAGLVADPSARAEAQFNAYRACLEQRDWTEALMALRQAASLDPERFAPFPLGKFEPERILGAGGFGVAFLCRNRHSGSRVVIKTLYADGLDRTVADIFREARLLEEVRHPAIIRVRDCDYADATQTHPYLVMDFFEGTTLAEHVEQQGPLAAEGLLPLARAVAEALQAAHDRGILHRDVKPANLLVRREGTDWQVRLIDFGLALRQATRQGTGSYDRSLAGQSLAGTLDYAAPEQLGRLPGVSVGPPADIYGFAKTCCYALFKTPQPTWQHWRKLPADLADLLGRCLAEKPAERPVGFAPLLRCIDRLLLPEARPVLEPERASAARRIPAVPQARPAEARERPRPQPLSPPRRVRPPAAPPPRPRSRAWPWLLGVGAGIFLLCGWGTWGVFSAMRTALSGLPRSSVPAFDYSVMRPPMPNLPAGIPGVPAAPPPRAEHVAVLAPPSGAAFLGNLPWAGLYLSCYKDQPRWLSAAELDKLLTDLRSDNVFALRDAAKRLGQVVPVEERRGEVAGMLKNLLRRHSVFDQEPAARALAVWGTPDSVPALIELLEARTPNLRGAAFDALAALKDDRAVEPVARRLTDYFDRPHARRTLEAFGPVAEKAVLPHLSDKDKGVRIEACHILQTIGSRDSTAALEAVARSAGRFDQDLVKAANDALAAIAARQGVGS
jgi:serine/threonine protein kinase